MKNKYMILSSMYRYTSKYDEILSNNELEKDFLNLSRSTFKVEKFLLKKSLKNWYDIVGKESLINTVDLLYSNCYEHHLAKAILIDIYLDNKSDFNCLEVSLVREKYLTCDKIETVVSRFKAINKDNDKVELKNTIYKIVEDFFTANEDSRKSMFAFFNSYEECLQYSKNIGFAAFDFSRMIDLIGCGHTVGYLSDEEAETMLTNIGIDAMEIFENWETFLFSSILGKLEMMYDGSVKGFSIIGSEDYINNIYGLVVSPSKPLFISNIWGNSNLEIVEKTLEQYVKIKEKVVLTEEQQTFMRKSEQSIAIYKNIIMEEAERKGLRFCFECSILSRSVFSPQDDSLQEQIWFWPKIKKMKIDLNDDEIPFLITDNCVFTTNGIYISEKKLFKTSIIKYTWNDTLSFEADLNMLSQIVLKLNGKKIFEVPPNYNKLGHTRFSFDSLAKKEALKIIDGDLIGFKNLFMSITNLKEII